MKNTLNTLLLAAALLGAGLHRAPAQTCWFNGAPYLDMSDLTNASDWCVWQYYSYTWIVLWSKAYPPPTNFVYLAANTTYSLTIGNSLAPTNGGGSATFTDGGGISYTLPYASPSVDFVGWTNSCPTLSSTWGKSSQVFFTGNCQNGLWSGGGDYGVLPDNPYLRLGPILYDMIYGGPGYIEAICEHFYPGKIGNPDLSGPETQYQACPAGSQTEYCVLVLNARASGATTAGTWSMGGWNAQAPDATADIVIPDGQLATIGEAVTFHYSSDGTSVIDSTTEGVHDSALATYNLRPDYYALWHGPAYSGPWTPETGFTWGTPFLLTTNLYYKLSLAYSNVCTSGSQPLATWVGLSSGTNNTSVVIPVQLNTGSLNVLGEIFEFSRDAYGRLNSYHQSGLQNFYCQ